jgi:carbon storage regulator
MLVLSRRCRESIVLPADGVTIRVLEIRANRVRLGIEAPSGVSVLRGELLCNAESGETQEVELQAAAASEPANGHSVQSGNGHGSAPVNRPLRNTPAGPRPWANEAPRRRPVLAAIGRSE